MTTKENKSVVEKINKAFDNNDTEGFLKYCDDEIVWKMPGFNNFKGVESIRAFMQNGPAEAPVFNVQNLIAENNFVMCNGDMKMKNNEGVAEDFSFCDVYYFENGKVNELTSYIIKLKN